jgi:hypothetical protein
VFSSKQFTSVVPNPVTELTAKLGAELLLWPTRHSVSGPLLYNLICAAPVRFTYTSSPVKIPPVKFADDPVITPVVRLETVVTPRFVVGAVRVPVNVPAPELIELTVVAPRFVVGAVSVPVNVPVVPDIAPEEVTDGVDRVPVMVVLPREVVPEFKLVTVVSPRFDVGAVSGPVNVPVVAFILVVVVAPKLQDPFTLSKELGDVVPIPTLPEVSITIRVALP